VLRVLRIFGSEGITVSFLLGLTSRGNMELSGGIFLSLLLEVKGLNVLAQLSLGISTGSREGFSLGGNFNDKWLEVKSGLNLGCSTLFKGLFEGCLNINELGDDVVELLSREGGGDLHEGKDGVAGSNLGELGEGSKYFLFGLNGSKFTNDNTDGFNDSFGFNVEFLESFSILGSLVADSGLLLIQDVELDDLVLEVSLELVDLVGEGGDFGSRFLDLVASEVDSSVVLEDFGFTLDFILGVLLVGLLLVENEILTELLEHLGDVGQGCLVIQLEGNGVQQFAAELVLFHCFELSEDSLIRVWVSLHEDGLSDDKS
jgi:hypothetical protein